MAGVTPGVNRSGGWAQFVKISAADFNCIKLLEGVDTLTAAMLGCCYMTAYHGVIHRGQVQAGQCIGVHGCGGVGLSAVQIAAAANAMVVAVDVDDRKLAKAKEEGAVATVNTRTTQNVSEAIKDITGGGVQVSVDALGRNFTIHNSINSLRKGGRHVQIGLTTQDEKGMVAIPIDILVNKEWEFVGSLGNPHPRYEELFTLIQRGNLYPKRLISQQVSIRDVGDVLNKMDNYDTMGFHVITRFS